MTEIGSDPEAGGPNGFDRVEFWVRTNPGTRPGPMMKVASGGELARFLLALKVVLADKGSAPTLVFDEIDTGVGGAVADAIGVRLARLSDKVQVLMVTHAPQVAARADRHYLISQDAFDKGKRVATRVAEVAAEQRREEIARMLAGAERLAALAAAERQADAAYREAAMALSAARRKAAARLDKAVQAELKPLKLDRAEFMTELASDPDSPGPNVIDRVEFWVRTNPGTRPGPLMKVASGGELARFLLALKVVLADKGSAPTLVFDEIDTGVGGAVADAIGVRLARLSERVQVLTVTHAPQVAARAERHYLISKDAFDKGKRVATRVAEVAAEERREEIARMLAGAEITKEARAAAERLIKQAAG
jgi:DNA repair ATPase RecN